MKADIRFFVLFCIIFLIACAIVTTFTIIFLNYGDCRQYGERMDYPVQYGLFPQQCQVNIDGRWHDVSNFVWGEK